MANYLVEVRDKSSWQYPVKDKDILTPPGAPAKGDRYLIKGTGAGGWAGKDNQIAYCSNAVGPVWAYIIPTEGFVVWVDDENKLYKYDGSSWGIIDLSKLHIQNTDKEIKDAAGTTKIQVEESAAEAKIRMDTGGVERSILDSTGRIMPTQPAFLVHPTATQSNIAKDEYVTVVFGTEIFDQGNNFAANTFTAPITGRYLLSINLYAEAVDTVEYYVRIHTSNRNYIIKLNKMSVDGALVWNCAIIADMDINDTAYISIYQSGGVVQTDIQTDSFFSGCLLY